MPGKLKQAIQKAYDKATGTERRTMSANYTVDEKDKTFSGIEIDRPKKTIYRLSNPELGSMKIVKKKDDRGFSKSFKTINKDASGKLLSKEFVKVSPTRKAHPLTPQGKPMMNSMSFSKPEPKNKKKK